MEDKTYNNVSEFFEKENRRIASRISWLFATQTLIFGAFEYVNNYDRIFKEHFLYAIGRIGFWSSVFFGISILAATLNYMYIYFPLSGTDKDEYPNLKGGKLQCIIIPLGFIGAVGLPLIFAVAWWNLPQLLLPLDTAADAVNSFARFHLER